MADTSVVLDLGAIAGIVLMAMFLIVLAFLMRDGGTRSMALRGLRRRGTSAWLTIIALAVGTAVIMSSLAVGDALKNMVVEKANANLNGVDVVVLSSDFFDVSVQEELAASRVCSEHCNEVSPAVIVPVVLYNPVSGRTSARATLYGFDANMSTDIGEFHVKGGGTTGPMVLEDGKMVLNDMAAKELDAYRHQEITVHLDNPAIKQETIFTDTGLEVVDLEVAAIVDNEGLGRFQLSVQDVQPAIFTSLSTIGDVLDLEGKANTILISLKDEDKGPEAIEDIRNGLSSVLKADDMGFEVEAVGGPGGDHLRLTDDRIFFDEMITYSINGMKDDDPTISVISTYFVDHLSLTHSNGTTSKISYSTVTGLDPVADAEFGLFTDNSTGKEIVGQLGPSGIGITNWTAYWLGAEIGDDITIGYSLIDDHFNVIKRSRQFTVEWVVEMEGKAVDGGVMPDYPGIEGIDSCFNWDPPFEIDWDSIEKKDEEYWHLFKGVPKAYIPLQAAFEMWGNDQGNITMVKVKGLTERLLELDLDSAAQYYSVGMVIVPIRDRLLGSTSAMDIFLEMFLAFGAITMIAGMVFVASTFQMMVKARRDELGTLLSLGISRGRVFEYLMAEGMVYAIIGSIVGLFLGLLAAGVLLLGLGTVWSSIVAGQTVVENVLVPSYLRLGSVLEALGGGLFLSLFTLSLLAKRSSGLSIMEARGHEGDPESSSGRRFARVLRYTLLMVGLGMFCAAFYLKDEAGLFGFLGLKGVVFVLWYMTLSAVSGRSSTGSDPGGRKGALFAMAFGALATLVAVAGAFVGFQDPPFSSLGLFVVEGLFMTISLFGIFIPLLFLLPTDSTGTSSTVALSFMRKEPSRMASTVAVFALIIFSVVSLSVIVEVQDAALSSTADAQGGGFDVMAEATSPIEMDLRTNASRRSEGINLSGAVDIIQLKTVGTSGAVCSNMNPQYPPRLIGANQDLIDRNRFELSSTLSGEDGMEAWDGLAGKVDGRIPIFVDENTLIIYIGYEAYAGALGHTFKVEGEGGTAELVVAGIVEPSVIAGSFVMHEDHLEEVFPTSSGYRLLLVRTDRPRAIGVELEDQLSGFGVDARPVKDIVRENTEAEQGYIGIFQAYLGVGLIIGITALSVTEARAVEERRRAIAMLRAVGVDRGNISRIFYTEATLVGTMSLAIGMTAGLLLAVTSRPVWGATSGLALPVQFLVIFSIVLILVLLISTMVPASRASRVRPAAILREEK